MTTTEKAPEYPEHEKLKAVQPQSQAVGEFLEDMGERGYVLCKLDEDRNLWYPVGKPVQELLAEAYDIDLDRLDDEKRDMLDRMRRMHEEDDRG